MVKNRDLATRLLCSRCPLFVSALAGQPVRAQDAAVLVEFDSPMKYVVISSDPAMGLAWTAPPFDDSAWQAGAYGMGYEADHGAEDLLLTNVPVGTSAVVTRATLVIPDLSEVEGVFIGADYDDAFVAWINGVEVHRSPQMPAGAPAWNTQPTLHESSNGYTADRTQLPLCSWTSRPARYR